MPPTRNTKILLCGTSDTTYPRDDSIVKALHGIEGCDIVDLRFRTDRWSGGLLRLFSQRSIPQRAWKRFLSRQIRTRLMHRDVDIVFIMRLNPSLCQQVAPVARQVGASVVYDFWVSRALVAERDGLDIAAARRRESQVARMATLGLTLTSAYSDYYSENLDCSPDKFVVVPLAVPAQWLNAPVHPHRKRREFVIAYWGNFLPQHGVQSVLLEAAQRLRSYEDIVFRLYGNAQNGNPFEMIRKHQENVQYCGSPSLDELISSVDACDVCVGHLRPIHDAHLVLPNKALEGMARHRPVVHVEAPQLFAQYGTPESSKRALQFFSGSATGLVDTILKLRGNSELRSRIGRNGRRCVERDHSLAATRRQLEAVVDRLRPHRR